MKIKYKFLLILPVMFLVGCSSTPGEDSSSSSQLNSSESISTSSTSTSQKDYEVKLSDGDISVISYPDEIVLGASNSYTINLGFSRQIINSKAEFEISDTSILPSSALSYHTNGDGSFHTSAYISIDASELTKEGTSYLEIEISSPNASSQGGLVCVELNFVETPNVTYYTETVIFEATSSFSKIKLEEGEKLLAQFRDNDHVVGVNNPNREDEENKTYSWFTRDISSLLNGEDEVSVTFKYAVNHNIQLRVYIADADGKLVNWYTINDSLGQGSSTTGFNQYDSDTAKLTFISDNSSLSLTITDKTYS